METVSNSKVYDFEEAYELMSKDSTVGNVWKTLGYQEKRYLFKEPRFKEYCRTNWERILNEEFVPFCDANPKNENLPDGKGGRTVYCVDPCTIIFQCMLMYDQNEQLNAASYEKLWMFVGKRVFGSGALERWNWISEGGVRDKCYELDVKKMEANFRVRDLLRISEIKFKALSPELQTDANYARLRNIYMGLAMGPFILPDGEIFLKGVAGDGGNPSGQFQTAIDNSLFALQMIITGHIFACQELGLHPEYGLFWAHYRGTIMGDDIALSLSAAREKWYRVNFHKSPAEYIAEANYRQSGIVFESPNWQGVAILQHQFCGQRFHKMTAPVTWLTFRVDRDRILNNLETGGKGSRLPPNQLQRIANYRVATWGDEVLRKDIEKIYTSYVAKMEKESPYLLDDEDWSQAKRGWLEDADLLNLYVYDLNDAPEKTSARNRLQSPVADI